MDDGTISQFYGFGASNCTGFTQLTAAQFGGGLLDIRTQLSTFSNFGEFLFPGTDHTTTQNANFYTRTAGNGDGGTPVLMTDWVASLLAGTATNPGP
jgi:hypothetical protein